MGLGGDMDAIHAAALVRQQHNNNNNSYRFRVLHQVCLPGSRSKTVHAMRCETCIHAVVTA